MLDLARHIENLLLEHDCVIIPGLGGFITQQADAVYLAQEGVFVPPSRSLAFNPALRINDGVLVQSYMTMYDTSFADATLRVEREVEAIATQLHETGSMALEGVGLLSCDIYGVYNFKPYEAKVSTPRLYGLEAFSITPLAELPTRETPRVQPAQAIEKESYHIRINRQFVRYAAVILLGVLSFFALTNPVANTGTQQANSLPFYALSLGSELIIPDSQITDSPKEQSTVADSLNPAMEVEVEKIPLSSPISSRRPTLEKESTDSQANFSSPAQPQPAARSIQPAKSFHIIVMAGITEKVAKEVVADLQTEGYRQAQWMKSNDLIRISIASFTDREEAMNLLAKLREEVRFEQAWLLKQ